MTITFIPENNNAINIVGLLGRKLDRLQYLRETNFPEDEDGCLTQKGLDLSDEKQTIEEFFFLKWYDDITDLFQYTDDSFTLLSEEWLGWFEATIRENLRPMSWAEFEMRMQTENDNNIYGPRWTIYGK